LSRFSRSVLSILLFITTVLVTCSIDAAGLYLALPSYFPVIDTSRVVIRMSQSELERDAGRAGILYGELGVRVGTRSRLRAGILYPAVQSEAAVTHTVGDGLVNWTTRIAGDTLDLSGLFFRVDARLPIGPGTMHPFSFGSFDGGAGLELRGGTALFDLRCSAAFTLVGKRRKTGDILHRNYTLLGLSMEFPMPGKTSVNVEGFGIMFNGGGTREIYLVNVRHGLSDELELLISGGLEAGSDEERVFNSIVSAVFIYRFARSGPEGDIGE
jgi:hypothetical protein